MRKVDFIEPGIMGKPMVRNLLKAELKLRFTTLTPPPSNK